VGGEGTEESRHAGTGLANGVGCQAQQPSEGGKGKGNRMPGPLAAGTFRADQIQGDPADYLRQADTGQVTSILVLPARGQQGGGVAQAQGVVLYHDTGGDTGWWDKLQEACQSGQMIEARFTIKS
jgi:hypothetical protein